MSQEIVFYTIEITDFEYFSYYDDGTLAFEASFEDSKYSRRINSVGDVQKKLVAYIREILKKNRGSSIHLGKAYVSSRPEIECETNDPFYWIVELKGSKRIGIKVYKVIVDITKINIDGFGHIEFSYPKYEDVDLGNFSKVSRLVTSDFISRIKGISNLNKVDGIKKEIEMFPEEIQKLLLDKLKTRLGQLQKMEKAKLIGRFSKLV